MNNTIAEHYRGEFATFNKQLLAIGGSVLYCGEETDLVEVFLHGAWNHTVYDASPKVKYLYHDRFEDKTKTLSGTLSDFTTVTITDEDGLDMLFAFGKNVTIFGWDSLGSLTQGFLTPRLLVQEGNFKLNKKSYFSDLKTPFSHFLF